jgi:methionyl-tRNA synthetase
MTMTKTLYLTTTIPYVNASPHVGFALELIQADVIARSHREQGFDVRFQTGTDENSLKNVQAAEKLGKLTEELVAENAQRFLDLQQALNISADDFIRTSSDPRHRPAVERLWHHCRESGDLYQKSYSGLYCTGCEQFYQPEELSYGCCPEHGTHPEEVTETNWFFRLSRYGDRLRELIETRELDITPESRRNEVIALIRAGLDDFSVSRSSTRARGWGIPVPDDPGQTIYVWYDALGNYLSALGYGSTDVDVDRFWNNAERREHLVGKGVTRFHAVYWPAILLSAGLPLPTRIYVHGYVTVDGRKIGKSNGNAIDPVPLVERFGADAVRYYLLRHIRATEDGDFTLERLEQAYTSELAGQLGNLAHRLLAITQKIDGQLTLSIASLDHAEVEAVRERVAYAVQKGEFHEALGSIWTLVAFANKHVADRQPWAIVKKISQETDERERWILQKAANVCLGELLGLVNEISSLLTPFLPETAGRLKEQLARAVEGGEARDSFHPVFPKLA